MRDSKPRTPEMPTRLGKSLRIPQIALPADDLAASLKHMSHYLAEADAMVRPVLLHHGQVIEQLNSVTVDIALIHRLAELKCLEEFESLKNSANAMRESRKPMVKYLRKSPKRTLKAS